MITREEAQQAYDELVQFRRLNPLNPKDYPLGGTELHHIIPTSCGGKDIPENLVRLLAKEHFMAHVYLWAIHHNDEFHAQTTSALLMMQVGTVRGTRSSIREFVLASEEYQKAREEFAAYTSETIGPKVSGKKNGKFGKHWYYDPETFESHVYSEFDAPVGWIQGRKCISKAVVIEREQIQQTQSQLRKEKNLAAYQTQVEWYRRMYKVYEKQGFSGVLKNFDYKYTAENFVIMCKKYLPEFLPHKGKRRKTMS